MASGSRGSGRPAALLAVLAVAAAVSASAAGGAGGGGLPLPEAHAVTINQCNDAHQYVPLHVCRAEGLVHVMRTAYLVPKTS